MSTKKKAIILFNSADLTGSEKHQAVNDLIARCRQDNYGVSRVFYYKNYCDHVMICKIIKSIKNNPGKITVILAKQQQENCNNTIMYSVLGVLAKLEQIELCFYEHGINLIKTSENEMRLIQRAVNYHKNASLMSA